MPFLWLPVLDSPGPDSDRGCIERNASALLSNHDAARPIDPPSATWLGRYAAADAIRRSGLWNVNHVVDGYVPAFIDTLDSYVNHRL